MIKIKVNKPVNILLWVSQIGLALYFIGGGIYMVNHYKVLGSVWALSILPNIAWVVLGILQVLFGVGLVLPRILKILPKLTSISAICLAIISLLGIVLYASYSGLGILWSIVPAVLLLFLAYKRWPKANKK